MRLDVYDKPVISVDSETGFFGVVRAGFCAPRKQLRNALTQGLGRPVAVIENILAQAGIDHKRRAETLTLQEWGKLCHAASR
jgi:16S rRNA (adenine1518-N6/adenine1519-N6)-dimethyltransferase